MNQVTVAGKATSVIEFRGQRVCVTKQLAEFYRCSEKNLADNFQNNAERFEDGKHFIKLEGEALRKFKNDIPDNIGYVPERAARLILWTEKGAARHAKMLSTDKAWEIFEELEDYYFRTNKGLQSIESLSPAMAKQIGGVIKAVVHKQLEEALTQALPMLVHGELAKHNLSVRYGCTSGQIWRKHGLPSEGMRGAANWLGNRLAERGCAVIDNGRAEMGGRLSRLFDPDRADVAMRGGLRSMCDRYVAERRGQRSLFLGAKTSPDQGAQL